MIRKAENFLNAHSRQSILIGYIFIWILFISIILRTTFRGTEGMELSWEFTCGMEILGIGICLIVYYSCMQNQDAFGSMTNIFSALLITVALNLFLDEWSWLVQGVPERHFENVLTNVVLYINTYTMGLMFWIYAFIVLDVKTRLTRLSTKIFIILYLVAVFICILNIFYPIYFSIGPDGFYRRAPLYSIRLFCYIALIPGIIDIIFNVKVPWKDRWIVCSFLFLPLLAETLSYFRFGLSTKPSASLLAIVLNYIVLVSNHEIRIARTQSALEIASSIQNGVLPKDASKLSGKKNYEIYASVTPAQEVGGDFYDYFMIDDDHLAIVVADVSDKGLGAAFFAMIAKVLIKTRAELGGTPTEIISYVENRITSANEFNMFVTVWLGIIDLTTGHVDVCNAGHDYPAIMKETGGFMIEKTPHGPPIAFLPGIPFTGYSFDLKPGNRIFLYTDGLTEAKRYNGERFGNDRMLEFLNSHKADDPKTLINAMKEEIEKFADGEPQFDDITMLTFKYL